MMVMDIATETLERSPQKPLALVNARLVNHFFEHIFDGAGAANHAFIRGLATKLNCMTAQKT